MIVQNVACTPIDITQNNSRISLYKDVLVGKKINKVLLYGADEDSDAYSPFTDIRLTYPADYEKLNIYLTLSDSKSVFVKDLDAYHLVKSDLDLRVNDVPIGRKVDFQKSFISYKLFDNKNTGTLLLYSFYQTRKLGRLTDEISGSVTVKLQTKIPFATIPLGPFIDKTLKGKKIKRIISDDHGTGYLFLKGLDGTRLEFIPVSFFRENYIYTPKDIFLLDNIPIDFDNSFYRAPDVYPGLTQSLTLTFIF